MGTWIVTGANRGIGLEMCRQLVARGERVFGACRRGSRELEETGCTVVEGVDVSTDKAGAVILDAIGDAKIDVLVNNAGVLDRAPGLGALDFERIQREYAVNTLGPLRVTEALLGRLDRGSKVAFISSRAGSIGDGPGGGLYGYRMSKAALNMAAVNLANDVSGRGILVTVLHPGFIRTEMTNNAGNEDPPVAVKGLLARIDELTPERNAKFFHANGQELPW